MKIIGKAIEGVKKSQDMMMIFATAFISISCIGLNTSKEVEAKARNAVMYEEENVDIHCGFDFSKVERNAYVFPMDI